MCQEGLEQKGVHRVSSAVWLWESYKVSKMEEKKRKKGALGEKVKSQRDARWRRLNSRVQTFTKELSQQLTAEDINWPFICAWRGWRGTVASSWSCAPCFSHPSACRGTAARCRALTAHFELLQHTFPPVPPTLMTHSTISWSAGLSARRWCIHTITPAQSVSLTIDSLLLCCNSQIP